MNNFYLKDNKDQFEIRDFRIRICLEYSDKIESRVIYQFINSLIS